MKKIKRPPVTGTLVGVRLQPSMLEWLDRQRNNFDPALTRPQMVRRVLDSAMQGENPKPKIKPYRLPQHRKPKE